MSRGSDYFSILYTIFRMDLSVIIVNYRGWEKLRDCLGSLSSYKGDRFTFEVIVADNNSDDGILESFITDYPRFRFIRNETNGGFAYGCNRGASESAGRFLLFLNPDTIAGEEAIGIMLDRAGRNRGKSIFSCRQSDEKGDESIAYGQFLVPGRLTGPGRALSRLINRITGKKKAASEENLLTPDWVSGSVILISRDFFSQLGGFDERFWMYFEDMDLCKRARNAGGEIFYCTDLTIEHKHGGSSRLNLSITALTKTEVLISKHLYIARHFSNVERILSHAFLVTVNIIVGVIESVVGIIFFFIPKAMVRVHIFIRLLGYYVGALIRGTWISPRSVRKEF